MVLRVRDSRMLRLTRLAQQVGQHLVDTPGITVEWVRG
jgi:hypothetical protein